jgi:Flp pilus assembly pilin Flp
MQQSRRHILASLLRDEFGGANTEYAVVIGLILLGVVAVLAQFGPRVLARWADVGQKLGNGPAHVVASDPSTNGSSAAQTIH